MTQLAIENDGLKEELRRLKPKQVINPKGKLVLLKQISDAERINRVYVIIHISKLGCFKHRNTPPWQLLEDYHKMLEKDGLIDVNISVNHFQPK